MENLLFKFNDKEIKSNDKTILCGIVNATPDSFSDGGKWFNKDDAVNRALQLVEDGAKMIDIGGESTRPGSHYVEIEEEIRRVVPVIKELKEKTDVIISVDTWKSEVAKAAIDAGVDIINDITGFIGDPKMAETVANSKAGAILMLNPVIARPKHEGSKIFPRFTKEEMFTEEDFRDFEKLNAIDLMTKYFEKSLSLASENGIEKNRIMLDPGIGFGLTKKENLELINSVDLIHKMGYFAFLGVSRKRFIVNILESAGFNLDTSTDEGFNNRDDGSAALSAIASFMGADVLRVHTIKRHLLASEIGDALRLSENAENINFGAYKNK